MVDAFGSDDPRKGSPAPRAGRRVLVVDDEPDLCELLRSNLRAEGYQVEIAHTGYECLEVITSFGPDLVLLDVVLPDLSGLEVCRMVRGGRGGHQPAIVMMTGRAAEADRVQGFELGADEYVMKPFSLREMVL